MRKRVSLGFIGLHVGGNHLAAARSVAGARPAALCDVDERLLAELAAEHRVGMTFTDYREMLDVDEIDAVVVAIPNALHEPVVRECLRAGKDVLCEKPPALNAALAGRMRDEARRRRRLLMYGFQRRHYAASRYAKKFLEQGKAGWLRRSAECADWFRQKKMSGGGPLIDLGVHHLDLILWLMDYPKPRMVLASTAREFGSYDVEDFATALVRFAGGLTLHIENTQTSHIGPDALEHLSLLGSQAGLSFNPLVIHSHRQGKHVDHTPRVRPDNWFDGSTQQMRVFTRKILAGDRDLSSARQGVALMKIIDAIYESARTGKAVAP